MDVSSFVSLAYCVVALLYKYVNIGLLVATLIFMHYSLQGIYED